MLILFHGSPFHSICICVYIISTIAPGIYPTADGDEVTLPLSVGEWIMQYWTEHMEQYRARPAGQRPFECTTYPGDVLFVPHVRMNCFKYLVEVSKKNCNLSYCHF